MHVSLSVSVCVRVCTCVRAAATGPLFDRLAREESERRGRMAPDPSHYDIINTPFKTEHHFFFFFFNSAIPLERLPAGSFSSPRVSSNVRREISR